MHASTESTEAPTAGRRRLSGRVERRGSQTGLSTLGAFAVGTLAVAVGTLIVLVGSRVIPVNPKSVHAPWWVLSVAGAVFALSGLMIWGMGWTQHAANRRRTKVAQSYRSEPAMADYAWDPRGFTVPRWKRALAAAAGAMFFTLFLSVFNWWAFFAKGPFLVKTIVVLFDLILILVWWQAIVFFGRALKFGGSRLEFSRFPFWLGEPVVLYWQAPAGIDAPRKGTLTLRCVEEYHERTGQGRNRSTRLVHDELWSADWQWDASHGVKSGKRLEARFDVPPDASPTCLSAEKPIFWEAEVRLDLPGFDFHETYLVPIYTRDEPRH